MIIVDNSGQGLVRQGAAGRSGAKVLENRENLGFAAAVNQGFRLSRSPYLATLNDDAAAHPGWLDALLGAIEARPDAGLCASQVRLAGEDRLDSAGMLIALDGSSKQRGQGEPPAGYAHPEEVLFPSASAALYRRAMLEDIGYFDDDFFLYCEDTDLGLRARWAGWKCLYVPEAIAEHRYSHTAGAASALKAYYVERNRLFVLVKNFPLRLLVRAPLATLARYFWHAVGRRGAAGRFRESGGGTLTLAWIAVRAHLATLARLPRLLRQRRQIRRRARIDAAGFCRLVRRHSIAAREVAAR